jgi:hypothetical protein
MTTTIERSTTGTTRPARTAAVAGIVFTLAWVTGLSIGSPSTDVHATGAQIIAAYTGHQGVGIAQFVLTEGIASVALAVVAVTLGRRAGGHGLARVVIWTGLSAALIALVQCALGIVMIAGTVPAGHAGTAATINDTINRMDGVKMFVLAAMAVAATLLASRTGILPRWLRWVGVALAVAIVASGLGYGLLNSTLAVAAWVSLPLLLVFVTGTGIVLGRGNHTNR